MIKDDEHQRDLALGGQGQRAHPVHHDWPGVVHQQLGGPCRSPPETRNSQVQYCVTFETSINQMVVIIQNLLSKSFQELHLQEFTKETRNCESVSLNFVTKSRLQQLHSIKGIIYKCLLTFIYLKNNQKIFSFRQFLYKNKD